MFHCVFLKTLFNFPYIHLYERSHRDIDYLLHFPLCFKYHLHIGDFTTYDNQLPTF